MPARVGSESGSGRFGAYVGLLYDTWLERLPLLQLIRHELAPLLIDFVSAAAKSFDLTFYGEALELLA